jgi:uncharacterized delta-60 repeat protein
MSDLTDFATAQVAVLNPQTSSSDLAIIAKHHASLRVLVANHVAVYPGLLDWLDARGDPTLSVAVQQRRNGGAVNVSGTTPTPTPTPMPMATPTPVAYQPPTTPTPPYTPPATPTPSPSPTLAAYTPPTMPTPPYASPSPTPPYTPPTPALSFAQPQGFPDPSPTQNKSKSKLIAIIASLVVLAILATVFVVVVLPKLTSKAPTSATAITWAKTFGGGDDDYFSAVAVAANGDIIAVGDTRSTGGDFPARRGKADVVVARFSPEGTLLWAKTYGGNGSDYFFSVAVAANGDIIAVGTTDSTDGDFPARHADQDGVVARFGSDGSLLWAKTYGGNAADFFYGVGLAAGGDIIAVGTTNSADGDFPSRHADQDMVVASFGSDGSLRWAKTYGGNAIDLCYGVGLAANGDIIAVGSTDSTDGDFSARHGYTDAFVARFGSDGALLWAKSYGGYGDDEFWGVVVAASGDIVVAGFTNSTDGDFPAHYGYNDAVVARLSATGTLLWVNTFGGSGDDYFGTVTITASEEIITTGYTDSTDGDFPVQHGHNDAVVARFGSDGTLLWAKTYGGGEDDFFAGAAMAANGDIVAVGYTDSYDGDFPALQAGYDAVIVRLSPEGQI